MIRYTYTLLASVYVLLRLFPELSPVRSGELSWAAPLSGCRCFRPMMSIFPSKTTQPFTHIPVNPSWQALKPMIGHSFTRKDGRKVQLHCREIEVAYDAVLAAVPRAHGLPVSLCLSREMRKGQRSD